MYVNPNQGPLKPSDAKNNILFRAAVITGREVAYGNGTARQTSSTMCKDLPAILAGTLDRFETHSTVVVDDATIADHAAHSNTVLAAGWNHAQVEAWTGYHRTDGRTVAVGIRSAMEERHNHFTLFSRDDAPDTTARLLDGYHRATGTSWRGTCAMSALTGIRLSWANERYQPLWRVARNPVRTGAGPLIWRRPLTDREHGWGYVHTFDANGAYLGSAISATLAWAELEHTGIQPFDPELPGYWLLDLDTSTLATIADKNRPPLLGRAATGRCWVTTPMAKLLQELGDRCEVADSWTGQPKHELATGRRIHPAGSRVTRRWGEHVRNGIRDHGDGAQLLKALKRTYKDAVGAMQRGTMRISRTDWAETIIDLWRATLLRRIHRIHGEIGYWPVEIKTDSISYADSNPNPAVLAQHVGVHTAGIWALGHFRRTATTPAREWAVKHELATRKRGV